LLLCVAFHRADVVAQLGASSRRFGAECFHLTAHWHPIPTSGTEV
jgi:hypothetical protein